MIMIFFFFSVPNSTWAPPEEEKTSWQTLQEQLREKWSAFRHDDGLLEQVKILLLVITKLTLHCQS